MHEEPMMGILIHRPVQDVFDYVMDIERTPRWRPRMSEVHWTTNDRPGVGSRFEVVVRTLGLTVKFEPEIIDGLKRAPSGVLVLRVRPGP